MKITSVLNRPSVILKPLFGALCALMVLTSASQAAQQGKGPKGPKPVGAVNSSNGGVYNPGDYSIVLKYFAFEPDQLYRGDDEIDFRRPTRGMMPGKKAYEKNIRKYQATLRTGLWKNMDARLVIPFWDKTLKRQSWNADFNDDNSGIGDITLFSRYRIFSQKQKDPFNMAIGLGLEIPTGDTDQKDSSGRTPGFIQTGGGAWNPIIELGAHKVAGRSRF